ncbi:hypothetical protein O181_079780 [Austropuccinia psidii MF-1]|uniref:Integrase catalytic domain-containing protein n=1 Tax=Austropuccinia psidii MF-1 TaxID=1389203 RepID=A0A9Q3FM14_9BASI|nr:hypothetical protein [Austropuccinia psidii MF-1]
MSINPPAEQSFPDDEGYRTKIITLTRENWVQWSCQFENFLTGKGHESLLSPPSESEKASPNFRRQNSSALALLWNCVSPELHGILLVNKNSFFDSWNALGKTCGKNSIVVMCDTLFKLVSLQYTPGSSLEKHMDTFQKTYASYESITLGSDDKMVISSTIAAAFFIRSLSHDRELSGLSQMLYDIKPFELSLVMNRVAIEHCRRGTHQEEALALDKQDKSNDSKPASRGNHRTRGRGTSRGRGKGKSTPQPRREDNSSGILEKLEKLYEMLEMKTKDHNVNVVAESSKESMGDHQQSDSDAYVMEDEVLTLGSGAPDEIYLDSGAGRSVVNNLSSLTNIIKVKKSINTYSEPVKITHQGTLVFRGIHISPVYFAPKGKVNLLSISQLIDHGLKPVFKGGCFLIMREGRIIATFSRLGNLFSSKIHTHSVFTVHHQNPSNDWHTVLGHPSDKYVKRLIQSKVISGNFTSSSSCPVCLHAKLKRQPHVHHLPSARSPFMKIHMDTLEISPPSHQGFCYILVIIDDFSHFNRIYLMAEKGISLERGPPHSPQTNGVAKRFNQTLLNKVRCLLAQSNIPITYWDEASKHASLLLNLLPHQYLKMKSLNEVLSELSSLIQPTISYHRLLPFGIKVVVKNEKPISKISCTGQAMKALTFEPYSDALRIYDPETNRIRITRDYTQLKSETAILLRKPQESLPQLIKKGYSNETSLPVLGRDLAPVHQTPNERVVMMIHQPQLSRITQRDREVTPMRCRQPPDRLMLADVVTYKQAISNPSEEKEWYEAMKQEFESLTSHHTGDLVPYPTDGTKVIGGMWRLTRKRNEFGEVYRRKARWVVLGNHQEHMVHYYDTWASVGRNETFKTLLVLTVTQGYIPYQFDIETAFLHGRMDANVYVKQVKGFEVPGKEGWVWRLNKSLYGTKQAPRMWQTKLAETLGEFGMKSSRSDESLYLDENKSLFLHVHVDDGFLIAKSENDILNFLEKLNKRLKLKYQKKPTQHLGYRLDWKYDGSVSLSQKDLILQLLKSHEMERCRGVKTPCNANLLKELEDLGEPVMITHFQQAIGTLNYIAQHTRPDILFTVNILSRHSTHPTAKHWVALKHLLRYLQASCDLSLCYSRPKEKKESSLIGWADADYANDRFDRKSISGNLITYCGNPISWTSKKQSVVAQSTTEAEFISMNICAKQLQWLTYLLHDLGQDIERPVICNDNSGATTISSQASLNANTKHIEIRYQYVRDVVLKKLMDVRQVGTNDMIADVLTKPMGTQKMTTVTKQLHLENQGGVL